MGSEITSTPLSLWWGGSFREDPGLKDRELIIPYTHCRTHKALGTSWDLGAIETKQNLQRSFTTPAIIHHKRLQNLIVAWAHDMAHAQARAIHTCQLHGQMQFQVAVRSCSNEFLLIILYINHSHGIINGAPRRLFVLPIVFVSETFILG